MKPFSIEEYLKNPDRKVVTRNGLPVRILCTDMKSEIPIVALISNNDGEELYYYYQNGRYYEDKVDGCDLMFAPTKKEGWVNLFKINSTIITGEVYNTEKEAKSAVVSSFIYISTVKVEWEE
nr:MAG TPA: hypothetical protein [Caudoviricetes sp.]